MKTRCSGFPQAVGSPELARNLDGGDVARALEGRKRGAALALEPKQPALVADPAARRLTSR